MKTFNVAIVGLGTVGSGVYKILKQKASLLAHRAGVRIRLVAACDNDAKKRRALNLSRSIAVRDLRQVVNDPKIDCIVELIGGKGIAKKLILDAFKNGKDVVTANKALLAECGKEVFAAAKRSDRQIYFEASVGGGIPVIKSLRESLVSNDISSILSIINGTANYILTRMSIDKMDFKQALKLAQHKGYAEADPSFDIEGIDSAHKITILSEIAFGKSVSLKEVYCQGITHIDEADIEFADEVGYVIKLLAIAKQTKGGIEIRVQPTLLPKDHILASVNGSFNAIYLHGDETGDMLLYGRGAGSRPTASAVVSDIIDLAKVRCANAPLLPYPAFAPISAKKLVDIESRYYLRFSVIDKPGVLSQISSLLGKQGISISDVMQRERKAGRVVPLIVLTHEAYEKNLRAAIKQIDRLKCIKKRTQVLRIEE
ncbi:MAG: homoserine dehydrogenase [Candidatus Omnitrophica bacterium]|nr:homoserine dehydrogenase [Candidatus Omnitrophota bacterium]